MYEPLSFIECQGLIKIYEKENFLRVTALKEINLSFKDNSLNAIIGPSGSGKSTLMKIIGGNEQVSAGTVRVGKHILSKMTNAELEQYRKNYVGFVNQIPENNLIYHISAMRNIQIPMAITGIPRETRKKRILELLELVGLSQRKNHSPGALSGGEAQRLALAVALANDPIVILADEPTGELDSATTEKIVQLFQDLNKEFGKTIIVATHDMRLAKYCDSYRIRNGRIVSSVLGFSQTYQSSIYNDELVYVDNFGTLTLREDLLVHMNQSNFVKLKFNSITKCIEIHSPNQ